MNENKEGRPTGKLSPDCTMMEVHCYLKNGLEPLKLGTHWVPISDEMKAEITSQNVGVVSMSAVVATPEMLERLDTGLTITPGVKISDVPKASKALVGFLGQDADEVVAAALAVRPDSVLPPGVTITAPPSYTLLSSLSEASGEETTPEEEEQWAAIRTDMSDKKDALTQGACPELANMLDAAPLPQVAAEDEVPQRRSTDIKEPENTGFNVNYYSVHITHPKRPERAPYIFEVEDLIAALNMTFHEGTVLKSLVRSCTERELGLAKLGNDAIRDAQKMVHSSGEHLRILKVRKLKSTGD